MIPYPVPHVVKIGNVAFNSGEFLPIAQTDVIANSATEAHVQTYMTRSGKWTGFSVYFRSANVSGDTTFTVRVNGVNTALTVTVPQSTTGHFQDLTNVVTVAVTDLVSIIVTTTGGTVAASGLPSITTLFTSDSGETVHYNMALDPDGYTNGTSPRFFRFAGVLTGAPTVETSCQSMVQHAGSIVSIGTYVSANARTTATTFRTRINTANGNCTFNVPASPSGTGFFVDTAHTDAVVAGDLINGTYTWAAGANGLTVRNIQYTLISTNPREMTFMGGNSMSKNASTGTAWNFAAGLLLNSGATESISRSYPITPGVMSGMAYYVSANTATQTLTYQMRRNGGNVNQLVPIATLVTGWLQDVSNSDAFDNDDYSNVNGSRSVAGTGATSLQNTSVKYTMDSILKVLMS